MGGNALKHLNPQRLTSTQVMNAYWRVKGVCNLLDLGDAHLVPWCLDKHEHGDVDILVVPKVSYDDLVGDVCDALYIEETVRNDTVTSCALPIDGGSIAQIDLINVEPHNLRHTLTYFAGGGLGMMIGRVAAAHGLVFAMDGLRLRHKADAPWSHDIFLTNCPHDSLQFLGYDPDKSFAFRNEVECWEYALSSPKAHPAMFTKENTNSENRSRDKGRPNFVRFQTWLRDTYGARCDEQLRQPTFEEAIDLVEPQYPWIAARIDGQEDLWNEGIANERLCGREAVLAAFPGLTPEQYGPIIRDMQQYLPDKESRAVLMTGGPTREHLITLARAAARICGRAHGHEPRS